MVNAGLSCFSGLDVSGSVPVNSGGVRGRAVRPGNGWTTGTRLLCLSFQSPPSSGLAEAAGVSCPVGSFFFFTPSFFGLPNCFPLPAPPPLQFPMEGPQDPWRPLLANMGCAHILGCRPRWRTPAQKSTLLQPGDQKSRVKLWTGPCCLRGLWGRSCLHRSASAGAGRPPRSGLVVGSSPLCLQHPMAFFPGTPVVFSLSHKHASLIGFGAHPKLVCPLGN